MGIARLVRKTETEQRPAKNMVIHHEANPGADSRP